MSSPDATREPAVRQPALWIATRRRTIKTTARDRNWPGRFFVSLGWRRGDSNPRPLQCDCSALPAELRPQAMRAAVASLPANILPSHAVGSMDARLGMFVSQSRAISPLDSRRVQSRAVCALAYFLTPWLVSAYGRSATRTKQDTSIIVPLRAQACCSFVGSDGDRSFNEELAA